MQHYFWKRQRLAELRFDAIKEINELTAEFITGYIDARNNSAEFIPTQEFFQLFQAATAKVRVLFSIQAWEIFKNVEIMIARGSDLGPEPGARTVDDFIQARDATLHALYKEADIPL